MLVSDVTSFLYLPVQYLLGAFAILQKATISFGLSVRPSVCLEQLGSHWKDFRKTLYFSRFRKSVEKIQVSLKSDK
jgi:hypothetical protein